MWEDVGVASLSSQAVKEMDMICLSSQAWEEVGVARGKVGVASSSSHTWEKMGVASSSQAWKKVGVAYESSREWEEEVSQ